MVSRPHVLLSVAMSADGYIDDASPGRLILSDEADLDRVDELRASCDAIMVGAATIRADDPGLAVRSAARRQRRVAAGQPASPLRVTLTASGDLDPGAKIFADPASAPIVYAPPGLTASLGARLAGAANVVAVPERPGDAALALGWILADLAGRGVARLMVEGGAVLLGQILSAGLADELILAIAPVLVADRAAARLLAGPAVTGRMRLAGVTQAGDMAVLRYLP
jgi:5-amino-6-(5-phosphoribosylamino)uracil reductase